MPALIIKPRLILFMHMDDVGYNITFNHQRQMFVQNLSRIVSKLNIMSVQILYCTTDCISVDLMFEENFPTNTHIWNHLSDLSNRNDCRQRGVIQVTFRCYNSNLYSVLSGRSVTMRSSVPPCAWVGPTTNCQLQCQPESLAMSKATTPRQFVVVDVIRFMVVRGGSH